MSSNFWEWFFELVMLSRWNSTCLITTIWPISTESFRALGVVVFMNIALYEGNNSWFWRMILTLLLLIQQFICSLQMKIETLALQQPCIFKPLVLWFRCWYKWKLQNKIWNIGRTKSTFWSMRSTQNSDTETLHLFTPCHLGCPQQLPKELQTQRTYVRRKTQVNQH